MFHLAISNMALRHAVLHERHVALHERHVAHHLLKRHHVPFNYCHVQLKPTPVIVMIKHFHNDYSLLGIHTYDITKA